jgi:hypothetical protein
MLKCKVFTVCVLCLALLLTVAFPTNAKIMPDPITGELSLKALPSHRAYTPQRDEDAFWTYRFMYSANGGMDWADMVGIGDLGMYEADGEEQVSNYTGVCEAFGSVVCGNDILHIIAVLNGFGEYNPLDRVNGVYHIGITSDGEATFNLIAAEGESQNFIWADAGIDADGNHLYATWWNPVVPEEGDAYGQLFASKSTDGGENWSEPFMVSEELDAASAYPHMTSAVGEYFYVIHQAANDEGLWDQFVLKVPAALEGEVVNIDTGVASGTEVSYYIAAVDPIVQDVDANYVAFCVRNDNTSGTTIASTSDGGDNWSTYTVAGSQRYPSMGLDKAGAPPTPWVFSNPGIPAEEGLHSAWYAFDENGYGGGLWTDPADYLGVQYPGEVCYVAGGVFTSEGVLIAGTNIWAYPDPYITPTGYAVVTSDDYGENWTEVNHLFNIWDEGLQGGYLTHNQLLTGPNNSAWLVNGSRYGYTDIVYPDIKVTALSSVMLGEDKVLTVEANDNVDIYYYEDDEIWDVWIDIYKVSDDTMADGTPRWVPVTFSYDDLNIDENGNGVYYFHLPDSLEYMSDMDTTYHYFEDGDLINFYAYCWDGTGNLSMDEERTWTVNQGWTEVKDNVAVPMNFEIGQNYPNPFNNSTVFPFTLDRDANVEITVYDLSGRLVSSVYNGKASAGQNVVSWEGNGVTTGVYIYTVEANGVRWVGKMTLLR